MIEPSPTRELSEFVANLEYADIPTPVIESAKDLFVDWLGSALAGRGARPVEALETFARLMGPAKGPCEILPSVEGATTSGLFAALINGAASHVVEQDDVHSGSVFHPATVIFPAVVAVGQAEGKSGRDVLVAAIAGYEVGIRIGEFLGRSHYTVFHTTGTAGTVAAAAAAAKLLGLDADATQHAFGTAGTQAAGLWEFLRDGADSKEIHTAKAAADGLLAAYLARDKVTGARRILEGAQGMAAGMSTDADASKLTAGLGTRWATSETSYKWYASCRHTHPAADALASLIKREGLTHDQIAEVTARVHKGAIDVLGQVTTPENIHQAKFSMGTVLGLIAVHGDARLDEFEHHALGDPRVLAFRERVNMVLDPEVDGLYPRQWTGKVDVRTTDGRMLSARVDVPKGDPGNGLSRAELADKAAKLGGFRGTATDAEVRAATERIWRLENEPLLGRLMHRPSSDATRQ
ncbi:MAG TPA: MmgE/PrpD family protein [Gemmatimonadaceae bacterium]|nr:MmgE/PrpD family protein [Gemmatimonadaceae bacterium]